MADRRRGATLAVREAWSQSRLFWRNPVQAVFLVALPLALVPLLHALNHDTMVPLPGDRAATEPLGFGANRYPIDQYLVPSLAAFGVASACFASLAIRITVAREQGSLKRLRGTPLPPWAHLVGRLGASVVLAICIAVATVALGVAAYDIQIPTRLLPAAVLTTALAAASFCSLGLAVTRVLPTAEAAPGIVLAILFPLAFVSNVFFTPDVAPEWMRTLGSWLPLGPAVRATVVAFNPSAAGAGIQVVELTKVVAWGGLGALAVKAFGWSPHHEQAAGRTRRTTRGLSTALPVALVAVLAVGVGWRTAQHDGGGLGLDVAAYEDLEARRPIIVEVEATVTARSVAAAFGPDGRLPLAVSRVGDGAQVLVARSPLGGCGAVAAGDVDPAWLVATGGGGAWLIDPCAATAYDRDGQCLSSGCQLGLVAVPAQVRGGRVYADLEHPRDPAGGIGTGPPIAADVGVEVDLYAGDGQRISAVWDNSGLRLVGDPGPPIVAFDATGRAGGVLSAVAVQGVPIRGLVAVRPLQWLSLPIGGDDVAGAIGGAGEVRITRDGATAWTMTGPGARLVFAIDRVERPWGRIIVDIDADEVELSLDLALA